MRYILMVLLCWGSIADGLASTEPRRQKKATVVYMQAEKVPVLNAEDVSFINEQTKYFKEIENPTSLQRLPVIKGLMVDALIDQVLPKSEKIILYLQKDWCGQAVKRGFIEKQCIDELFKPTSFSQVFLEGQMSFEKHIFVFPERKDQLRFYLKSEMVSLKNLTQICAILLQTYIALRIEEDSLKYLLGKGFDVYDLSLVKETFKSFSKGGDLQDVEAEMLKAIETKVTRYMIAVFGAEHPVLSSNILAQASSIDVTFGLSRLTEFMTSSTEESSMKLRAMRWSMQTWFALRDIVEDKFMMSFTDACHYNKIVKDVIGIKPTPTTRQIDFLASMVATKELTPPEEFRLQIDKLKADVVAKSDDQELQKQLAAVARLEAQVAELKKMNQIQAAKIKNQAAELVTYEGRLKSQNAALDDVRQRLEKADAANKSLRSDAAKFDQQKREADQAVQREQELRLSLNTLEAGYKQLVAKNEDYQQKLKQERTALKAEVASLQENHQKMQKAHADEKKKLNEEVMSLRGENQKVVLELNEGQEAHQKATEKFNEEMAELRKTIEVLQDNLKQIEALRAQDQDAMQRKNAELESVVLQRDEQVKLLDTQLLEARTTLNQALNDYLNLSKRFQLMLFDAAEGAFARGYQEGQAILLYPPVVENTNNNHSN